MAIFLERYIILICWVFSFLIKKQDVIYFRSYDILCDVTRLKSFCRTNAVVILLKRKQKRRKKKKKMKKKRRIKMKIKEKIGIERRKLTAVSQWSLINGR